MVLVTWFGHSSVAFETQQDLYLCDPISDPSLCSDLPELAQPPRAIFVSHKHWDHFSPETLALIAGEETCLFAPKAVIDVAEADDKLAHLTMRPIEPGDAVDLGDVVCEVFEASEGVGYVLTFKRDDIVAFVMGDSTLLEPMEDIETDLTFFPMWALQNAENGSALSEFLNLSISIPVHYHHDRSARSNFFLHPDEFARLTEPLETIKVLKRGCHYEVRVSDGKVLIDRIPSTSD